MASKLSDQPHRRFNPLSGEWTLVSPQRSERPWQGRTETPDEKHQSHYDPDCYLCPGNARAGGARNPDYRATFTFDNDFPALLPDVADAEPVDDDLFSARAESGRCRVICFSPRHDLTVADMALEGVEAVVSTWQQEYRRFESDASTGYVQIFENRGELMGCSNPHPHCQVWATQTLPTIAATEDERQRGYLARHSRPLLLDYADQERASGERTVYENEHFLVVVPYWAVWPFETLILPLAHRASLAGLDAGELRGLADAYRSITRIYNRLFDIEFPYSAGIHQAPADGDRHDAWQLHMHFYPPLLRSATVRKFMVGFEMLAMPQRDLTPEQAADRLRDARKKAGL